MLSLNVRSKPPNLAQVISELPRSVRGAAVEGASKYLVGDGTHGLRHYPAYQYITRARAYGNPFFSERQRRFVFAAIREGRIDPGYPHRTGRLQRGWQIYFDGVKSRIVNEEAYAPFVMGDGVQARLNKLVGWRVVSQIVASNEKGMIQAADKAAQDKINAMGL